jgi:hypothetical protein
MDAVYPSAKDPIARLFDVSRGVLYRRVGLDKQRRSTWPSEANDWLDQFTRKNFMLLHAGVKCLILMSKTDHNLGYLSLIEQMPDQSLVQRANALRPFSVTFRGMKSPASNGKHRIRVTFEKDALSAVSDSTEKVQLVLIIKRRWAELWDPEELEGWQNRLEAHCQPGVPLTPPPFTPDVVRAYIKGYQQPPGGMRRAA